MQILHYLSIYQPGLMKIIGLLRIAYDGPNLKKNLSL